MGPMFVNASDPRADAARTTRMTNHDTATFGTTRGGRSLGVVTTHEPHLSQRTDGLHVRTPGNETLRQATVRRAPPPREAATTASRETTGRTSLSDRRSGGTEPPGAADGAARVYRRTVAVAVATPWRFRLRSPAAGSRARSARTHRASGTPCAGGTPPSWGSGTSARRPRGCSRRRPRAWRS